MNDVAPSTPGASEAEVSPGTELTPRQLEILALLKAGKANKDIAYELGIGLGTVKQHVVALFKKLNVTNRAMAVGKGWQIAGRVNPAAAAPVALGDAVQSALELRPACVLSLSVDGAGEEAWRLLQNAATQATAQEDSTLVARPASGVDVIFGLNRVREDDVLRAVKVARAVAAALDQACAAAARPAPMLRAGLACGYLVASIERTGGWTGETVAGRLIGDARALRAAAPPDGLLADSQAQRMTAFARRADGERAPGPGAPLRLSLRGEVRRTRRAAAPPVAIVGRQGEMDRLRARVDALGAGRGGLVWLEGEAGMGKTTLGRAVVERAAERGANTLEIRCGGAERDFGLTLLGLAGHRSRLAEPPVETVVDAVRRAACRPLALMVDDVHQARPRDAALIRELAALSRSVPMLLLGVSRSLRPEPLRELAADETVKLTRLSADEVAEIVRVETRGRLRRRQAQSIVALAQGVPLFAHELAWEALHHECGLSETAPRLPLTLAALVMSRLDTLALDRPLLRLAARDSMDERTLAGLWPGLPEDLPHEVARAVRAGILVRADAAVGFAHPLVRAILAHVLMAGQGDLAAGIEAGRAAIAAT